MTFAVVRQRNTASVARAELVLRRFTTGQSDVQRRTRLFVPATPAQFWLRCSGVLVGFSDLVVMPVEGFGKRLKRMERALINRGWLNEKI